MTARYPLYNVVWPLGVLVFFLSQLEGPTRLPMGGGVNVLREPGSVRQLVERNNHRIPSKNWTSSMNVVAPFCTNVEVYRSVGSSRVEPERMVGGQSNELVSVR